MIRIQYFQHVPFEGPAAIETWAQERNYPLSGTFFYEGALPPSVDTYDWLVVLGGPMGVHDESRFPWLVQEKAAIVKALDAGKPVLGICLGAQLVAHVLGAPVTVNREREIGFFPVQLTPEAAGTALFDGLPQQFAAFHWHGETFGIPPGAVHAVSSAGCTNQAFEYQGCVAGLQFHLESNVKSIAGLLKNCSDEVIPGQFVQNVTELEKAGPKTADLSATMNTLFGNFEKLFSRP